MQLDVEWFVSAMIDNELMTREEALALDRELGGNAPLADFAQTRLERMAQSLNEDETAQLVSSIQQLIDFAVTQAETGTVPAVFADNPPPKPHPKAVAKKISAGKLPGSLSKDGVKSAMSLAGTGFPCFDVMMGLDDKQLGEMMKSLLLQVVDYGASDLYLSGDAAPFVRRNQVIERISDLVITPKYAEKLNTFLLTPDQLARFTRTDRLEMMLDLRKNRFRVTLMRHKNGILGSYRIIPDKIEPLEELGFLPENAAVLEALMGLPEGLVLVTGPAAAGRTTTVASLIEICNQTRQTHIICLESPVEIIHTPANSQLTQRQLPDDQSAYADALRAALRQDSEVIAIDNLSECEVIESALAAAGSGHLVVGILNTRDASDTVDRLIAAFPLSRQSRIRAMTAENLRGIVSQKLIPAADGNLTVVYEVFLNLPAAAAIIAAGQSLDFRTVMAEERESGMCTMDDIILTKCRMGAVTRETARTYLSDPALLPHRGESHHAAAEAR